MDPPSPTAADRFHDAFRTNERPLTQQTVQLGKLYLLPGKLQASCIIEHYVSLSSPKDAGMYEHEIDVAQIHP